jgi:hypothetical protein
MDFQHFAKTSSSLVALTNRAGLFSPVARASKWASPHLKGVLSLVCFLGMLFLAFGFLGYSVRFPVRLHPSVQLGIRTL